MFTVAGDARTGARRSETVELGLGDAADVAAFLVEALHDDAAIVDFSQWSRPTLSAAGSPSRTRSKS
jgi:hypothetical protein